MVLLARLFAWREALTVVKLDTLVRWHRKGFGLLWRWKSRPRGRSRIPVELLKLIAQIAGENSTWGEERIAAELLLKLGIRISPRTVRRYMPCDPGPQPRTSSQRWMTFVHNHADAILACDLFVTVTATFRLLYVFVVMEVGTRRMAQFNVTAHPTADWTLHQFREGIMGEKPYQFLIHERDSLFTAELDSTLRSMGLSILKTPFRAPQANVFCERLIGSIRRECLGFLIPLNESHLRRILKEWVVHYNRGSPALQLGPGIPESSGNIEAPPRSGRGIPCGHRVVGSPALGGPHHEYRLEKIAA